MAVVLKLIQVGDIHYPDAARDSALVDNKDPGFPEAIVDQIIAKPLQQVSKKIQQLHVNEDIAAILFCGDLTTRGDLPGYEKCIKYLVEALRIMDCNAWPANTVHVVPGNHDVDHSAVAPRANDPFAKFDLLVNAWAPYSNDILPIRSYRKTDVSRSGCTVVMFSLNSCLGCGEWRQRLMPAGLPDDLATALHTYMSSDDVQYERLDTPAFRQDDIDSVAAVAEELPSSSIPIVIAHHNILPQAVPRIANYTEVINAGLVRGRFAQCRRPIIYCHGHIHDDPVEHLSHPSEHPNDSRSFVAVSAPLINDGFNVIGIHFSRSQHAIGCEIDRYRLDRSGCVQRSQAPLRVPFYDPSRALADNLVDRSVAAMLRRLPQTTTNYVRFDELRGSRRSSAMRDLLLEAEWLGLVRIASRDKDPGVWQVARVLP